MYCVCALFSFFFQAEDGIRDYKVTGVQTCALPISENLTDAQAEGMYPAATAGLAVHLLRRRGRVLHGFRVIAMVAAGAMPRVVAAEQIGRASCRERE